MSEEKTNDTTSATNVNDLPDHLLLHIFSFLPTTRYTALTSYVSRKWRKLWLSNPSLKFHCYTGSHDLETLHRFASYVDKTLIRRPPNAPLRTFSITLDSNNGVLNSHVDAWIRYAVSRGVENLHLRLDSFDWFGNSTEQNLHLRFEFALCVLRDSQVRVLKLFGCDLSLPSENTRFGSLRSVRLDGVRLTDRMVADLVAVCVNLQVLVLSAVHGCQDVKICSSKLEELTIEFMKLEQGSVEVDAPNLCALNIDCCFIGNFVLRDASSLVEAIVNLGKYQYWVKVMSFLRHVQCLRSPNFWYELVVSKDVYSGCFVLLNLKHVQLRTGYTKSDLMGISVLLVLSPNLETMILDNGSPLVELMFEGQMTEEIISEDFFKQLDFNVQRLSYVEMKSFVGTECEKNFAIVLLKTAVTLESIMLIPEKYGEVTPRPPIVLDPQLNSLQDLEYVVSQIPRWRKPEDAY